MIKLEYEMADPSDHGSVFGHSHAIHTPFWRQKLFRSSHKRGEHGGIVKHM